MENVLEQKKAAKRKRLLDAAYTLFQEKGAANTTINDIAKEAQVAKGTFYLYFRDKTEILDALVMQICHKVFRNACIHLAQEDSACLADRVVSLVDYILEYFKQDPLTLSVLRRNFTWRPVLDAELHTSDPVLEPAPTPHPQQPCHAGTDRGRDHQPGVRPHGNGGFGGLRRHHRAHAGRH